MKIEEAGLAIRRPLESASTDELVSELFAQSTKLVKTEVALAKAELLADLKREAQGAEGPGIAAVCALCGLNLLLMASVLALAYALPAWAAALVVAGLVLVTGAVAATQGWGRRVTNPLARRPNLPKEDVRWAREGLA